MRVVELRDFYFILVGVALALGEFLKYGCIVRMYCMGDERKQKRTVTHSSNPKREKEREMEIKCWLGPRTDGDHTIIQTTKTKTINRGVSCSCSCEQN